MTNRNPATILYDGYGKPLAVLEGDFVFNDHPGLLFAGIDENGLARFVNLTSTGALQTAPVGERTLDGEFYFGSGLIAGAGTAQTLVTLENPSGSGKNIYLNRVIVNGTLADKFTTPFVYRLTRTVGIPTGGTIQTIQKRNSSDASAIGIVRAAPTAVTAAGDIWTGCPGMNDKVGFFQSLTDPVVNFQEKREIVIAPGEAIAILADPNGTIWNHWVNLHWNEVTN